MTDVESRLLDLFEAIDRQTATPTRPPLDQPSLARHDQARRPRRRLVVVAAAAAAAAIAAAVAIAVWPMPRDDGPHVVAAGPAVTQPAATFDAAVGTLCRNLADARAGVRPRFETPEAYEVAAANRRSAIDAFAGGLGALAPPVDDPEVVARTLFGLREARDLAGRVDAAARSGDLTTAATTFAALDGATADALSDLRARGAHSCA